jgi:uncharacterized protein (DUF302 family)
MMIGSEMDLSPPALNINIHLHKEFPIVLDKVISSLKKEGFVVLTEIDIKETLKRKLNVDALPFKVMRVYHPQIAANAHAAVPEFALLPYTVTVSQMEDGAIEIAVVDPLPARTLAENAALQPFIRDAYAKLQFLAGWWSKIR